MMSSRVVYFDHSADVENLSEPFRIGEAGFVWVNEDGDMTSDTRVLIPPNTVHALHAHGVIEQINALDLALGPLDEGREAVVSPGTVEDVTRIFYEADRMTYGQVHDLCVAAIDGTEYRIVIDNREYQRTLSRLQFLSGTAARLGHGLRFRIG
jgi:hypothetical protein